MVTTPIVALLVECLGWSLVAEDLSETAVECVDDGPSLPETQFFSGAARRSLQRLTGRR